MDDRFKPLDRNKLRPIEFGEKIRKGSKLFLHVGSNESGEPLFETVYFGFWYDHPYGNPVIGFIDDGVRVCER